MATNTNSEANTTAAPADPIRFLGRSALCRRLGISRSTSYNLERDGYLPRPIRIGRGVLRWSLAELEAFEARAAADRGTKP